MTQRITQSMVKNRLAILNDVFEYDREPYAKDSQGNIKGNHGTFILDSAYGGYRLSQMACPNGGTGERDLSPPWKLAANI